MEPEPETPDLSYDELVLVLWFIAICLAVIDYALVIARVIEGHPLLVHP